MCLSLFVKYGNPYQIKKTVNKLQENFTFNRIHIPPLLPLILGILHTL